MQPAGKLMFLDLPSRNETHDSDNVKLLIRKLRISYDEYFLNDHPMRVAILSDEIAKFRGYSPEWRRSLAVAALLHDIGKVHPDCRHMFTAGFKQFDLESRMKATAIHQQMGPIVLAGIDLGKYESCRAKARFVCEHHHNQADSIPRLSPETLIVAVADAWDALTSNVPGETERGYRAPYTTIEARGILYEEMEFGKFDPHMVVALFRVVLPRVVPSSRNRKSIPSFHQQSFDWT